MTVWVGSVACATCCWTVSYAVTYLEFNLFLFSYFYFTRNSTLMFCFCDFPFRSRSTINSIAFKSHHGDQFQVTMVTGVEQPSGWCTLPSPPPRPLLLSLWVARIYELQQQVITLVRTLLLQWDCYWVSPGEENNIFFVFFFVVHVHAHLLMWICVVFWTSCVQTSGGSGCGGEMTLDPDHMSRSLGSSPTLPAAWPLCSSLSYISLLISICGVLLH